MNEVVEGPRIGMAVTMDRFGFRNGSARDRVIGDMPLIESIDVAGEMPSEMCERRFRGYEEISINKEDILVKPTK